MDSNLTKRLRRIEEQVQSVYQAEEKFLTLDAAKDHTLAVLTSKADGTSQAAKDVMAKATPEWFEFRKALAVAEADFHRQRHILDLKLKAFDAEYLSLKVETPVIKRQGGAA